MSKHIAVIGAGLAGAVLSQRLTQAGLEVTVFEKSRGTGGRFSSTRVQETSADIGLPYFSDISDEFKQWLDQQSCITTWATHERSSTGSLVSSEYLTAAPRFSALTRNLLTGASLHTRCRISHILPGNLGVELQDDNGNSIGHFDAVIITAPSPQAAALLDTVPRFIGRAKAAIPTANWVVVLGLPKATDEPADILWGTGPIVRAIRDSAKPGRTPSNLEEVWVLEASSGWTENHLEASEEEVIEKLKSACEEMLGQELKPALQHAHRWLYARPNPSPLDNTDGTVDNYLWSHQDRVGVCGDWLKTGMHQTPAEGAWKSAQALANTVLIDLNE